MTIPTEAEARADVTEAIKDFAQLPNGVTIAWWARSMAGEEPLTYCSLYEPLLDAALDRYRDVILANQPCYEPGEPHGIYGETMVLDIAIQDDCGRCPTCEARRRLEE